MDDQDANQLSDIESYLVNFNREISDELPSTSTTSAYLYATNTILSNGDDIYTELRSAVGTDKAVKSNATQENEVVTADDQNIVKSTELQSEQTEAPFSTVTIMPAELNQDLQYMLIVSNPDEPAEKISNNAGSSKQNELSVFDFDEEANVAVDGEEKDRLAGSEELYEEDDDEDDDDDDDYIDEKNGERSGNIYKCNHCSYTSTKRFQLSRHLKSHSDDRPHKCDYCTFAFKSRVALTNHTNTHKGVRPNKCKECEACFTTTGELIRHVRYRHTYEKPHRCTVCNYASVELSKLRRHVRSHTGERPYQCPHCPYASPDTFKLKRHIRVHTGERPYKCDICDMRFTQSNSLKSHRLIHTGARPIFKCELCPSTCTRKTDLRNHVLRIHTSDKPLLCRKCGKNFPDRYTYRIHSRTHDGQKCFKCELCPYSASVQRHLEHHIMTHTGERPYKCNLCHQAFRQKTLLRKHYSSVHNANSDLALKQRAKIHICPYCRRAFANEGSMTKHVKRQHGDEEVEEGDEEEDNSEESRGESSKVTRIRKHSEVNGGNEHNVIEYLEMEAENDDGSEEEDVTEQSPPPRKIKSSITPKDFDQDSTPSLTAKKRRGRPRKTPCIEKDSDDDYMPKTAASVGRSNGIATPRRRGRPPKRRLVFMETEEDEENFDDEEHDEDDETYNANSRQLIRRKIQIATRQKFQYPDGTLAYDGEENEEAEEEDDGDGEDIMVNGRESHIL